MTKKQEEQLRILLVVIKRVELGRNHYDYEIYEKYKKEKGGFNARLFKNIPRYSLRCYYL